MLSILPEDKIEVSCSNPEVPSDKTNLAFKAARLLKEDLSISSGIRINIEKHIPVAAGLGGGSSNAASVLLGLNRLLHLKLDKKNMMKYASKLGADVAFFINEEPFALGTKRGDAIKPLSVKKVFWHVLAVPKITVSTGEIYESYSKDLRLTKPKFNIKILTYALSKGDIYTLGSLIYNGLEAATIKKYRRVAKVLGMFRQLGIASGMSGSGSAVFGIALNKETAERIAGSLRRLKDLRVFVVRSC
jgi:4-diphosphocytidyl-2-C-methyl-D-erythritol kinase